MSKPNPATFQRSSRRRRLSARRQVQQFGGSGRLDHLGAQAAGDGDCAYRLGDSFLAPSLTAAAALMIAAALATRTAADLGGLSSRRYGWDVEGAK